MDLLAMQIRTLVLVSALAACAGPGQNTPEKPMSAAEHLAEAERHERQAAHIDDQPAELAGGDVSPTVAGVSTVSTSGGAPLTQPRWSYAMAPTMEHTLEAKRLREHAAQHRQLAKGLIEAEKHACSGLQQEDIDTGPFFHSHEITKVTAVEEQGALRGARIRFAAVPGLGAPWMQRAVECAMARAAVLGYPQDYLRESPIMLENVSATVRQDGANVEVTIRSDDPTTAVKILGRAEGLLARQNQTARP
jgi:hypothetical protein